MQLKYPSAPLLGIMITNRLGVLEIKLTTERRQALSAAGSKEDKMKDKNKEAREDLLRRMHSQNNHSMSEQDKLVVQKRVDKIMASINSKKK